MSKVTIVATFVLTSIMSCPIASAQSGGRTNEAEIAQLKQQIQAQQKQIEELRSLLQDQMGQLERMTAGAPASNRVASSSPELTSAQKTANSDYAPLSRPTAPQSGDLNDLSKNLEGVSKNVAGFKFSACPGQRDFRTRPLRSAFGSGNRDDRTRRGDLQRPRFPDRPSGLRCEYCHPPLPGGPGAHVISAMAEPLVRAKRTEQERPDGSLLRAST
jgi:hypothetical protein